jgi:omega-6 fatty acid desaturase (delta-12 desaturase)
VLHWLTGNIGFHHVHHLNPRVPNYRLSDAHEVVHALHPVPPLTLWRGLAATFLTLWDEQRGRLVRFRDVAA